VTVTITPKDQYGQNIDVARLYDQEGKELMGQFLVDVYAPNYDLVSASQTANGKTDNLNKPVTETLFELTPVKNDNEQTLTATFTLKRAAKTTVVVSYDETDIHNGPDSFVEVSPD
jgi:23S rRNA G2069 N7-methylase RlmK/C1962 C5-methylase RlmI